MKKTLIFIFILIAGVNISYGMGCQKGSGTDVKKEFNIDGVTKIDFGTIGNLYIKQGDINYMRIETDDNILPHIEIDKSTNELRISNKKNICPTKLTYFITVKDLEELVISGSGNVIGKGEFAVDDLRLEIDGSGDLSFEKFDGNRFQLRINGSGDIEIGYIQSNKTSVVINGSGDVEIAGKSQFLECKINGSGDVDLEDLRSRFFKASIFGSGDISVSVDERLEAKIVGSGDIYYKGEPKNLSISTIGSGELIKMD